MTFSYAFWMKFQSGSKLNSNQRIPVLNHIFPQASSINVTWVRTNVSGTIVYQLNFSDLITGGAAPLATIAKVIKQTL